MLAVASTPWALSQSLMIVWMPACSRYRTKRDLKWPRWLKKGVCPLMSRERLAMPSIHRNIQPSLDSRLHHPRFEASLLGQQYPGHLCHLIFWTVPSHVDTTGPCFVTTQQTYASTRMRLAHPYLETTTSCLGMRSLDGHDHQQQPHPRHPRLRQTRRVQMMPISKMKEP